jgi:hypothetical protein
MMAEDPAARVAADAAWTGEEPCVVSVRVQPGACGFACTVRARKTDRRTVAVAIVGSQCQQIQKLSEGVTSLSLKEIFTPLTRNPVYACAEQCGCHASCAIPAAILKAAEVALGMAVPRDVQFQIACQPEGAD